VVQVRRRSTPSPGTWLQNRHLAAEVESGVTAKVIHPGDLKTDMWADIQATSQRLGARAEPFLQWADWVEKTGGDDPEKAADLIINLMGDKAALVNGQLFWIKDGLQAPIASWSVGSESLPWLKQRD
jgi:NAD(P)-dependent dehydrogenase (short-subunit alcohol dehydrogenase family)